MAQGIEVTWSGNWHDVTSSHIGTGSSIQAGYTCSACGAWVSYGTSHVCTSMLGDHYVAERDDEIQAIEELCSVLEKLDALPRESWERIAAYVSDRFGIFISQEKDDAKDET